jgi:hypothetical protein
MATLTLSGPTCVLADASFAVHVMVQGASPGATVHAGLRCVNHGGSGSSEPPLPGPIEFPTSSTGAGFGVFEDITLADEGHHMLVAFATDDQHDSFPPAPHSIEVVPP